jgi:Tol biopolymer transport system component
VDDPEAGSDGASVHDQHEGRLDSWKKIASYLRRDVSTVQRWERREGMPVRRHLHDKLGSVFAYRSELDSWWEGRRPELTRDAVREVRPQGLRASADTPGAAARRGRRASLAQLAMACSVTLIAGALAWLAAERGFFWRSPLASAKFTRLSDFAGTVQAATISPNGRLVAFLAGPDGQIDAWVGEVAGGTYRNLTQGQVPELVNPSIRPLGFSSDSSLVSIWTRRADGSQPGDVSLLAAPTTGGSLRPYLPGAAEFAWSRDGRWLVYHTTAPGDPLFVRDSAGPADRGSRRIYVAAAGIHCHFPVWSPDGAFVYFVRGVPPDHWDVWRIRRSGAGLERITAHNTRVTYPVMLDQRTLIYLATDVDGFGPWIYGMDVERRHPHRLSFGLEAYNSLTASADGSRLVATTTNRRTSIWRIRVPAERGVAPAAAIPSLVSTSGATPRAGADFLLYVAREGQRQGIWALARGVKREIWSSAQARIVGGPAVAPDGRRIAFTVQHNGRTLLQVIDADGSGLRAVADSLALRGNPAWAPDGRSIVSGVMRDGEPRLTRIPLNGDSPLQLVSEYSVDPVWSPDGRFLIYSGADVGTTFPLRAAAADGRPYPLPGALLTRGARRVAFLQNGQALVILRGEIGHKDFWLFDLRTGAERLLSKVPADFVIGDFDVAADGSEIVFDRVQLSSEMALIERGQGSAAR